MQKWEYKRVWLGEAGPTTEEMLETNGKDGWELVGWDRQEFIFKRPKT